MELDAHRKDNAYSPVTTKRRAGRLIPAERGYGMNNMTTEQNVYQKHGYRNRREYLLDLATEYGQHPATVYALANNLGKKEDFDGLVNALEDIEM